MLTLETVKYVLTPWKNLLMQTHTVNMFAFHMLLLCLQGIVPDSHLDKRACIHIQLVLIFLLAPDTGGDILS